MSDWDAVTAGGVVLCLFVTFLLLGTSLSIAELVLYQQYKDNHPDCNNNRLIDPVTWLEVDGAVNIAITGLILIILTLGVCGWEGSAMCGFGIAILLGLFGFAWMIIGAVMLWRDNLNCSPEPLHDILWAAVIIRLIFTANACLGRGNTGNN